MTGVRIPVGALQSGFLLAVLVCEQPGDSTQCSDQCDSKDSHTQPRYLAKTELQFIQRTGRILQKHGDQRPHSHHFVAVPDEQHLDGVDGKALAQELYWVRELGERIGRQADIEPAAVDPDVVARARQRGNELWAEGLIAEEDVESVDGPIDLEEILASFTPTAAEILLEEVTYAVLERLSHL